MIKQLLIIIMFNSLSFGIDKITDTDIGTYNLLNAQMQPSPMLIYFGKKDNAWIVYGKDNDASDWKNISCDQGCEYKYSTQEELDMYMYFIFGERKNEFEIACIQNKANAFCKFQQKSTMSQFYALIALVTARPIPIFLKKLNNENHISK